MKKVTVLALGLFISLSGFTQKVYFVYLESENQQPFFVRMNEKTYSSTSLGYLVLSKLRDSSYNINIGFPGSQAADYKFSVVVNKKDQGYLLKNMGENGWGLYNMQTLALQMGDNKAPDVAKTEKKEPNSFTDMLSKAVDDSTLKEKPVVVKEEIKEDIIPPVEKKEEPKQEVKEPPVIKTEEIKKDEILTVKNEEIKSDSVEKKEEPKTEIKEEPKKDTVQQVTENTATEEVYKKSTVTRRSESSTTEGFGLTFLDVYPDGKTDTIRILIPNEATKPPVQDVKEEEKRFLDIPLADTSQKQVVKEEKNVTEAPVSDKPKTEGIPIKNSCNNFASEDDFFKLRKKMAAEISDENMIAEAKKIFRTKCFTVQQVKNLSALFLSDEGKYKFFDSAYSYVADLENFASLQSELKEEYFINRFKAMLRN